MSSVDDRNIESKQILKSKVRQGAIDIDEILNPDPNNYSDLEFDG